AAPAGAGGYGQEVRLFAHADRAGALCPGPFSFTTGGQPVKLTPQERERRKHENSARRKNEKLKEALPLFFDQLAPEEKHTPDSEYWRDRFRRAAVPKNGTVFNYAFLCDLQLHMVRRHARHLLGADL